MDMGRRAFLRGRPRLPAEALRPPWAGDEAIFLPACDRCGDCIAACSTALLVRGGGGFPEADFSRGHCTFCADCAHACADAARKSVFRKRPALDFSPGAPWSLRAVVDTACLPRRGVFCRSCEEHCAAGAIRFPPRAGGPARPVVETSFCTGCGLCAAACPSLAISMRRRPDPAPAP